MTSIPNSVPKSMPSNGQMSRSTYYHWLRPRFENIKGRTPKIKASDVHQNWSQSCLGSFNGSLEDRHAVLMSLCRELHDQDGIFLQEDQSA